jgi:TolA-binding protein
MRLSRRPGVWLATLSTVVAVATGMFTLRDQIFPRQAGTTQASVLVYEQSVGETCDALNQAAKARVKTATQLAERLRHARTDVAQRNALLDSTRQIITRSEQALIRFRGLVVPGALAGHERATATAWVHECDVMSSGLTRQGTGRSWSRR